MEIKGNGFLLRKWKRDDATALQRLADNPKIAANLYNRFPSPYTMDDAHFFINLKIDEDPITSFVVELTAALQAPLAFIFAKMFTSVRP